MDLLPKRSEEFDKKSYWDDFFQKLGEKAFEWYGEFDALQPILTKYMLTKDNVLVVGCGNSNLSSDLYKYGIPAITNIDITENVIEKMANTSPGNMKWLTMDVRKMSFQNEEFSVILDKATLDAILKDGSDDANQSASSMIKEIDRVLTRGGRFICVSLLQEHVLKFILDAAFASNWCFRIHRCIKAEKGDADGYGIIFPIFVVVCVKLANKWPVIVSQIMEIAAEDDVNMIKRVSSQEEIMREVAAVQHYAFVRNRLSQRNVSDDNIRLELYSQSGEKPRYVLYVVDMQGNAANKFAIFIVPHGRETEWLFKSTQGQRQLAKSAGFQRLVVVHLNRDHVYLSMDQVKAELSQKVMELAPLNFNVKKTQVPFLSVGEDLGKRTISHKGLSSSSGEFFVEDVRVHEQGTFRRLVFANNPNVIQSEVKLMGKRNAKSVIDKAQKELPIDYHYLACEHHVSMVISLAFVDPSTPLKKLLIIGLGGGALPMYLHHHLPNVSIDVLEIDQDMVTMAIACFNFHTDERMRVTVVDGLEFIADTDKKHEPRFDIVMIDADSKDVSVGMSCPPVAFVDKETLQSIRNILTPQGILVLNLVCRDGALRQEVLSRIGSVFPSVFTLDIAEEVNVVVYGFKDQMTDLPSWCRKELRHMTGNLQLKGRGKDGTSAVRSLSKLLSDIKKC